MAQAKEAWKKYIDTLIARGHIENVAITSPNGELWASNDEKQFYLKEYKGMVVDESGEEKEQLINEADNILTFLKGAKPPQGLRISGQKYQVLRTSTADGTGYITVYGKMTGGGSCCINAGKCILIGTFSEAKDHKAEKCYDVLQLMGNYLAKSVWPESAATVSTTSPPTSTPATTQPAAVAAAPGNTDRFQNDITALMKSGSILDCGIISKADAKLLAKSKGFQLPTYEQEIAQEDGTDKLETVDEAANVLKYMNEEKPSQGLRISKSKFQVLQTFVEANCGCYTLYGKKMLGGVCIIACNTVVIIAVFDEKLGHSAPPCNEAMSSLAKGLKDAGL